MPRGGGPYRAGEKLFHLLMHSSKLLEDRCRDALSEHGLHHGQARVLMALNRHGPQVQADLARGMELSPPTLSVMLKRLLDEKLVRRSSVAGDERVYRIALTAAGERAAERVRQVWEDADRLLIEAVGRADVEVTHRALLRMRDALGGRPPKL